MKITLNIEDVKKAIVNFVMNETGQNFDTKDVSFEDRYSDFKGAAVEKVKPEDEKEDAE